MRPVFLKGENIMLSPLSAKHDLTDYASWLNDQETVLFIAGGKFPSTKEALAEYIDSCKHSNEGMLLGIFLNKSYKHIGNIALNHIMWKDRYADIGVLIGDKKSRGKGYAIEAVKLLTEHAFYKLNLHKIYAGMVKENKASINAFNRLGFKIEARFRKHCFVNNRYLDCYKMGLLKEEYKGIVTR